MAKNLFLLICEELNIPHTRTFTNCTFDEHPNKDSIFGLAQMLESYGVMSHAVRYHDKAVTLKDIHTPFVAQLSDEWVLVKTITDKEVVYVYHDTLVRTSHEAFIGIWTNAVLLVTPNDDAGEPNYLEHRREERRERIRAIRTNLSEPLRILTKCLKKS